MKTVILLVGPMGSGKSTLCEKRFPNATRISQDDQGRDGHIKLYQEALERGDNTIVVDRINHTRAQRNRYLSLAKEKGYDVNAIVLNEKYDICFNRIKARQKHPTLSSSVGDMTIQKALSMYFKEYHYVSYSEGFNIIERLTDFDPFILDLSYKYDNAVIIGDVHGCFDELEELIMNISLQGNTAIVFAGDLVDKGPKIQETWNYFLSLPNAYSVMGNHENKLLRYLQGNNVNITHGLDKSIKQMGLEDISTEKAQKMRMELENLPLIIKLVGGRYVVHAGINPERSIERQFKESCLYTRNWNPDTKSFNTEGDKPWYHYYDCVALPHIYFGHQVHENKTKVSASATALDGGCVHGGQLKAALVRGVDEHMIISVNAHNKYCPRLGEQEEWNAPYDALVAKGLLRKVEDGDLVLYNYTDKCTYERAWNEYTIRSRGLIFEKETGRVIARPFPKFFNLNEHPSTQQNKLPKESYECYEKMDGSLGIIFNYKGNWRIATRGSFTSDQALRGHEMLHNNYDLSSLDKRYTYLAEIIYPENKIIVDYKDQEDLVLLGAINTQTGHEYTREVLEATAQATGMHICQKYNYTFDQMLKLKTEIDKNDEGFVVKFKNGFRVKIKGEDYVRLQKILSRVSPISLWESMENGVVSKEYLSHIPEEVMPEIEPLIGVLQEKYESIRQQVVIEWEKIYQNLAKGRKHIDFTDGKNKKALALYLKQDLTTTHKSVMFAMADNKYDVCDKYIMNRIYPKGNIL